MILLIDHVGTSLVVQWLRVCFPMQGMQVRFLVGELRSHMQLSLGAATTDPVRSRARAWQLEKLTSREKPACRNERSQMPQRRSRMLQLRPDAAKERKKERTRPMFQSWLCP